jgi:PilZ domain-containing protein
LALKQSLLVGSPSGSAIGGSEPSDSVERRKNKRFAVSASAELLESQTSTRLNGRVSDLGVGGCYIDTVSPLPVGTSLLIKLVSGSHSVSAKAAVVYAQVGMGMGLVFTEISADHKERLSAWLRELNGEPCEEHPSQADTPKPSISCGTAEPEGLLQALRDLVSLLGERGVLSESEVEVLREKMGK